MSNELREVWDRAAMRVQVARAHAQLCHREYVECVSRHGATSDLAQTAADAVRRATNELALAMSLYYEHAEVARMSDRPEAA